MHYPSFANVTTSDLLRVQDAVLQNESTDALIASLAQRPFWEQYAREFHAQRFEDLVQPLHQRMEALQAQVDEQVISENEFLQRCEALKADFDRSERALLARLAREAYERWANTPLDGSRGLHRRYQAARLFARTLRACCRYASRAICSCAVSDRPSLVRRQIMSAVCSAHSSSSR